VFYVNSFLFELNSEPLLFEAMWALSNIALNGTPEQVEAIMDAGAVPAVVKLLKLLKHSDVEVVYAILYFIIL